MSRDDLDKELDGFDTVRWTVICRAMMLRIARGEYEGAHAGLRNFCRQPFRELATTESSVGAVFDKRIANQLERGGYFDVESVRLADDEDLREISCIGQVAVAHIRERIEEVMQGKYVETYGPDDDLVDPELCARALPPYMEGHEGTMTNEQQVIAALELLTNSPDTALDVIDSRIRKLEAELAMLQNAKRLFCREKFNEHDGASTPKVTRAVQAERSAASTEKWAWLSEKVVHFIENVGAPQKPAVIAEALGVSPVQVGRAVTACRDLGRMADGRVRLEALAVA